MKQIISRNIACIIMLTVLCAQFTAYTTGAPSPRPEVNVKDYGAIGDGLADDTAAIRSAMNDTPAGGTVIFPEGEYLITSKLALPRNDSSGGSARINIGFEGIGTAQLSFRPSSPDFMFTNNRQWSNEVRYKNLILDGGGIIFERRAVNVSIEDCIFQNNPFVDGVRGAEWIHPTSIFIGGTDNDNITIKNNLFKNPPCTNDPCTVEANAVNPCSVTMNAIIGYGVNNLNIINNEFSDVAQCVSVKIDRQGRGDNIVISGNHAKGIRRMGIEVQDQGSSGRTGLVIEDNYFHDWHNYEWPEGEDSHYMGISAVGNTVGARIANNTVICAGDIPVWGIELGETDAVVENNYLKGLGCGVMIGSAPGCTIKNNYIEDVNEHGIFKYNAGVGHELKILSNVIVNAGSRGVAGFWGFANNSLIQDNLIVRTPGHFSDDASRDIYTGIQVGEHTTSVIDNTVVVLPRDGSAANNYFGIRIAGVPCPVGGPECPDRDNCVESRPQHIVIDGNNFIFKETRNGYLGIALNNPGALGNVTVINNKFQGVFRPSGGAGDIAASNMQSGNIWINGTAANENFTAVNISAAQTVYLAAPKVFEEQDGEAYVEVNVVNMDTAGANKPIYLYAMQYGGGELLAADAVIDIFDMAAGYDTVMLQFEKMHAETEYIKIFAWDEALSPYAAAKIIID